MGFYFGALGIGLMPQASIDVTDRWGTYFLRFVTGSFDFDSGFPEYTSYGLFFFVWVIGGFLCY